MVEVIVTITDVVIATDISEHLLPCLTTQYLPYRAVVRRDNVCKASKRYHVHTVGVP